MPMYSWRWQKVTCNQPMKDTNKALYNTTAGSTVVLGETDGKAVQTYENPPPLHGVSDFVSSDSCFLQVATVIVTMMNHVLLEALNVRMIGSGEKILVLAHGFGTDQSAWQRIYPSFTPYYRVVLYDLVCAGSVNPDFFDFRRYTTLHAYVDDLIKILDALAVDSCAYVGHSVSAMIGILAAIKRPELFSKLILLGASPRFVNDREYHGGFEKWEIESVFTAMEANYESWVNGFAPLAVGADVPAAVQEFTRTLFNMRPDISLFVSRTIFNSDLRGVLGLVTVPCTIIQTAKDCSVPLSVAKYLRDHMGGRSSIEMLETEGHLPHLSAPQLLVRKLRRALSR